MKCLDNSLEQEDLVYISNIVKVFALGTFVMLAGPRNFFSFCIPSYIVGFAIFGVIFAYREFPTRAVYLKHDI